MVVAINFKVNVKTFDVLAIIIKAINFIAFIIMVAVIITNLKATIISSLTIVVIVTIIVIIEEVAIIKSILIMKMIFTVIVN